MQMIDQEKRIQRKQVQERLGISQTTSGRILKQMVKKGLIMQRGRGKNTCYVKKSLRDNVQDMIGRKQQMHMKIYSDHIK